MAKFNWVKWWDYWNSDWVDTVCVPINPRDFGSGHCVRCMLSDNGGVYYTAYVDVEVPGREIRPIQMPIYICSRCHELWSPETLQFPPISDEERAWLLLLV